MPDLPEKPDGSARACQIARLIRDTGITEAEATELVAVLGTDWAPLVREARLLKAKR
jgi:hypothetical protein